MSSDSTTPSGTATDSGTALPQQPAPRDDRARSDAMDVALLKQGGIYAVTGESGDTYRVDIMEESCTCPDYQSREPDGGCKHVRRVGFELDQNTVPRPDGNLPAAALETTGSGSAVAGNGTNTSTRNDADYQQAAAAVFDAIQAREEEIARLQAEIEALEFVRDTLEVLRDPDAEFSLDAVRDDR